MPSLLAVLLFSSVRALFISQLPLQDLWLSVWHIYTFCRVSRVGHQVELMRWAFVTSICIADQRHYLLQHWRKIAEVSLIFKGRVMGCLWSF